MAYRSVVSPYAGKYVGVDLPSNSRADCHLDKNGHVPLDDYYADVVLSTQVLEHVPDPIDYLSECNRLLKPDGILILSTHGYWKFHGAPHDYRRWTSTGLRAEIENRGFGILSFVGSIGLSAAGLQLFQDGVIFKVPGFLRPVFYFVMQTAIEIFDRLTKEETRAQDAAVYIVVAQKRTAPSN